MNVFTNCLKPLGGFEGETRVFVFSFNFKNNFFFFFPVRFVFNKMMYFVVLEALIRRFRKIVESDF